MENGKKNIEDSIVSKKDFSATQKEVFKMRVIDFSVTVMKATQKLRKDPVLWPVCDQLVRSSSSIGANINEAQGAHSRKDFANYFQIALKSARETRYWIQVVERYDSKNIQMKHLYDENEHLINILQASIKMLRSSL
jgi:four helix bundle protein